MSHISNTKLRLDSKEAVVRMCQLLPELFTFRDRKTFKSYGHANWKCDFAISVAGANYEVGFEKQSDGTLKPLVDWWSSGGLRKALDGEEMPVLMKGYNVAKTALESERLGYTTALAHMPNGKYKMLVTKNQNKHKFGWKTALKKLATGRILGGNS